MILLEGHQDGGRMKVVVAMDSFKGSLPATEACEAVARGLLALDPSLDVILNPMADGGEGTAKTLIAATDGEWVPVQVTGPLPEMRLEAGYAWLPDSGPGALVEMAAASGLGLLRPDQLDPMVTTTFGTGELLAAATARGARRLWLAIGGSATVDGGLGAAKARGWSFLDEDGHDVGLGGQALERVAEIRRPTEGVGVDLPPVEVLCDVDNPLLGEKGAARIFGPQKGASPQVVEMLEVGLSRLADRVESQLGLDVRDIAGAGAAGGLGAAAVAFMNATLVSGVDAVMRATRLEESIQAADWVITGEGRFDSQSLHGKVVSGIARLAAEHGTRMGVLAGSVVVSREEAALNGVHDFEGASPEDMALETAMAQGAELLEAAAHRLGSREIHPNG